MLSCFDFVRELDFFAVAVRMVLAVFCGEVKFGSYEELAAQIKKDAASARAYFEKK